MLLEIAKKPDFQTKVWRRAPQHRLVSHLCVWYQWIPCLIYCPAVFPFFQKKSLLTQKMHRTKSDDITRPVG